MALQQYALLLHSVQSRNNKLGYSYTHISAPMSQFFFLASFPDSASLGAALRAAHGWLCNKKGSFVPISSMYKDKLEKTSLACKFSVAAGDQELVSKYAVLMKKRIEIENRLVQKFGRC